MSKKYQERVAKGSGFSTKEFTSDFGLKILKKFGWKEGEGLGANKDGITECVQIKRRAVGAGVGAEEVDGVHDAKHWENWWSDAYNNAAAKSGAITNDAAKDEGSSSSSRYMLRDE